MESAVKQTRKMNVTTKFERFGSHSGDAENSSIRGCDTVSCSVWCSKGLYYLQNCALLYYYTANSDNFLSTFPNNLSVPTSGIQKGFIISSKFQWAHERISL
jgi:hypothetical protein